MTSSSVPTTLLRRALPKGVRDLCAILHDRGHGAWAVGGCVRDVLMGRTASDWDVATTALPAEVQRIFRRTIPTGIDHGTVTVLLGGEKYEVTTLRGEAGYADGRRPDAVYFVGAIDEDLGRRDFTVNAIAYHPIDDTIVDPWHGLVDLERRTIRAVRDPMERFAEDGLRVLRAARFVATLGFDLDPATEAAIRPNLATFSQVSAERVRDEWVKALRAARPSRAFRIMRRTGMLEVAAPLVASLDEPTFERTMARVDGAPDEPVFARLAALVWDRRERRDELDAWLRSFRWSNREREAALLALRHAEAEARADLPSTRRFLREVGAGDAFWVLSVLEADSATRDAEAEGRVRALRERCASILDRGDPLDLKALRVTGADVMSASGRGPGRYVGAVLERLLDEVLDDPARNDRERLLARARDLATGEGA
jgi:tRNA nucleotidyltransferase (CCA-adding enzyme)